MSVQSIRSKNLRALVREWDGPKALADKLGYSGPSYVSQLTSGRKHRQIGEKTARDIEKKLGLPDGWLDQDHDLTGPTIDITLMNQVMRAVMTAGADLSPDQLATFVSTIYDDAKAKGGRVDTLLIERIVGMMK